MSNLVNTNLLEEAAFYIDYFEGTMLGKAIEADIKYNDMDALYGHVEDARGLAFQIEYNPEVV